MCFVFGIVRVIERAIDHRQQCNIGGHGRVAMSERFLSQLHVASPFIDQTRCSVKNAKPDTSMYTVLPDQTVPFSSRANHLESL
jgi:hypothetical protein